MSGDATIQDDSPSTPQDHERLIRRLHELVSAAVRIQEALTPDDVLAEMGAQLRTTGLQWCYALIDHARDELVIENFSLPPATITIVEHLLGVKAIGLRLQITDAQVMTSAVRERRATYAPGEVGIQEAFRRVPGAIIRQVVALIGARGIIVAPLLARRQIFGVLIVWSNDLTSGDLPGIAAFAQQAATAYDNAQLYEEGRQARARAEDAERRQREADDTLRAVFESSPLAMIVYDVDGVVKAWNGSAERIYGWRAEEVIGRPAPILWQSKREEFMENLSRVLRGESLLGLEARRFRKDGSPMDVSIWTARLHDALGNVSGMVSIVADVSERKRAEEAQRFLAESSVILGSSLDYETILGNIAHLIVPRLADWCAVDVIEDDEANSYPGRIRRVAVAHADPSKEELVRDLERFYPPDPDAEYGLPQVMRTGQSLMVSHVYDEQLVGSARDKRHLAIMRSLGCTSYIVVPLSTRERILGAISLMSSSQERRYGQADLALAQDLARRVAMAIDNARLYRQARDLIRSREEFMSVAAHELKTPLTSLRGFAQVIVRQIDRDGVLDPSRVRWAMQAIDQQTEKLTHLVVQLLDVSRIEAGRLSLVRGLADLTALTESVAAMVRVGARDHTITVRSPGAVFAEVDAVRIEQVMRNLLDNAVRYSPDGGQIEVDLSSPTSETVRLTVRDHGIGILAEHRPHIFSRFYQADSSGPGGGMGLGLYISRQIVDLHGGRLELADVPDGGTCFVLTLPVSAPSTDDETPEDGDIP